MNGSVIEALRRARALAFDAQSRLGGAAPKTPPSQKARESAAAKIHQAIAARAARVKACTPARRVQQRQRVASLARAARERIATLREREAALPRADKLRPLAHRITSFTAIDAQLKRLRAAAQPDALNAARETTLIVDTGARTDAGAVGRAVVAALAPVLGERVHESFVRVEPLYRRHRTSELFCADLALGRGHSFALRFRLAEHVRKTCRYKSVHYERGDDLRYMCTWRRTEPAPSSTRWALRLMNVPEAWQLAPRDGGAIKGEGVVIGHPDTGWNRHSEYNRRQIDIERQHNTFFDTTGEDVALHPTHPQAFPINNLTHGSGSGSVIIGGRRRTKTTHVNPVPPGTGKESEDALDIVGIAPRATIVPVRCVDRVELTPDNRNLGRAIEYLMGLDDPPVSVISISLGGAPHYSLEEIIHDAVVDRNIIVVAATGQIAFSSWTNSVVEPADYIDSIAVAGCTDIPHPWDQSLRGPRVAVSAPAAGIYCADYRNEASVEPITVFGDGTTFAAAEVAGIAALWIAFHGRDRLLEKYGGQVPLAYVFRQLLMQTANPARIVDNTNELFPCSEAWPADFGAGVVDAAALLAADLPDPDDVRAPPGQTDQNIIALIPELERWFRDRLDEARKAGNDAYREVREWLDDTSMWFAARSGEVERGARGLQNDLEGLWHDAEAAWQDASGGAQEGLRAIADGLGAAWNAAADATDQAADDAAAAGEDLIEQGGEVVEDIVEAGSEAAEPIVDAILGLWPD